VAELIDAAEVALIGDRFFDWFDKDPLATRARVWDVNVDVNAVGATMEVIVASISVVQARPIFDLL
jgi:hypothetical protein